MITMPYRDPLKAKEYSRNHKRRVRSGVHKQLRVEAKGMDGGDCPTVPTCPTDDPGDALKTGEDIRRTLGRALRRVEARPDLDPISSARAVASLVAQAVRVLFGSEVEARLTEIEEHLGLRPPARIEAIPTSQEGASDEKG
jgi:hypothetical protein